MKVFISDAIGHERLPFSNSKEIVYGKAHYSWKLISKMYHEALEKIHIHTWNISAPDIYQSEEARHLAHISAEDIHIAVKPIEHIRPMFGVRNFFVCGWEFPEFSKECLDGNPNNNYVAIMKRAERVMCWSSFSASNLKRYGVRSAVALPPPVVALMDKRHEFSGDIVCCHYAPSEPHNFAYSSLGAVRENYHHVFFIVMNPWDRRKNFASLVQAFTKYKSSIGKSKKSALVIKLVIDNVTTLAEHSIEILEKHFGTENISEDIYFFGKNILSSQMVGLYKKFDFYISSSSAEGLNLPLIEAMAVGMVPISSTATAMGDYITEENALVLPTSSATADAHFSALAGSLKLTHFPPEQEELMTSFAKATDMTSAMRNAKSARARQTVEERYGLSRFDQDFRKVAGVQ
ncbi:glycosyltransferase [Novosphingobium sp. 9U]|uniref:glycosyltransferase n=1 Tax=Novosphingobium sp. 9U TaxID=2653158 RepID=UPI0012EFD5DE|nr:glycosyltransferase [Novosphingobium sp. 9U]VWX53877.1 putative Glycosyltransferase family 1 protein [Novosphingobium sp. 9U]